jgi:hypothetical protein
MRRGAGIIVSILVVVLALAWFWPWRALDLLGRVMAAAGLSGGFDAVLTGIQDHPDLATAIMPWILAIAGLASLFYLVAWPSLAALIGAHDLQIVFAPDDSQYLQTREESWDDLPPEAVTRFYVGLRNGRRRRAILSVNLRARSDDDFVQQVLGPAHARPADEVEPILAEEITLDPGTTYFVELFGLNLAQARTRSANFADQHAFVLDARGQDVTSAVAEFVFDLDASPVLRRVR